MSQQTEIVIKTYHKTVTAFRFEGEFPLAFLRHDETVRSAPEVGGGIWIERRPGILTVYANFGDYIVREPDGQITVLGPRAFQRHYSRGLSAASPVEPSPGDADA